MHKLSAKHIALLCILLVVCTLLVVCYFQSHYLNTGDTLSLSYSYNTTLFPSAQSSQQFYVLDNVLYFVENRGDKAVIRYVKKNWIRTFAEMPANYKRFIVVDGKTVIVEIKNVIYSLDVSSGDLTKLWKGSCVGYHLKDVYFTDGSALYIRKITEDEPRKVTAFDEVLASYADGMVYKNSMGIYRLMYENPNEPQLITEGTILWPEVPKNAGLLDVAYLYTSEYALRIGSNTLDMYVYDTGEIQRIYETDAGNMVIMAVAASENELYVSRQWVDMKFWLLENQDINGTYKYDILKKAWTKITNKTYSVIGRFDEQYLYGIDLFRILGGIKQINVD